VSITDVIALQSESDPYQLLVPLARAHRRWCVIDYSLMGVLGVLGLAQIVALALRSTWAARPGQLHVTSVCLLALFGLSTWTASMRRRAFNALTETHDAILSAEFLRATGKSCALRGVLRVLRDKGDA
jgi:hypothetical protein